MVLIESEFFGNCLCNLGAIAREHDRLPNASSMQALDAFGGVILNHISNNDMTCIFTVN